MNGALARLERGSIPEPNSGCLLWMGAHLPYGYGVVWWDGRRRLAHRLAWSAANKREIPPKMVVCHKCDVPSCVNPDHLWLGTQGENNRDTVAKGRHVSGLVPLLGEKNAASKLTADKVRRIREDKRRDHEIAASYGISRNHVGRLKRKERWGHI